MHQNQAVAVPTDRTTATSPADPIRLPIIQVPAIYDLRTVTCPLQRNLKITSWYHNVDLAMSRYLGEPDIPTWARFAKYASFNAGLQIRNIQEGKQAFEAMIAAKNLLNESAFPLQAKLLISTGRAGVRFIREVLDLLKHKGLIGEAILFALSESAISDRDRQLLGRTLGLDGFKCALLRGCLIARNIPKLLRSLQTVSVGLTQIEAHLAGANQAIYEFMAPRLAKFLINHNQSIGIDARSCPAETAEQFFATALDLYAAGRELGISARGEAEPTVRDELLSRRRELVHQGNILATYGEQVFRAQPHLDQVAQFIARSTRFIRFTFPGISVTFGASTRVERDWSRPYDRMGIDRESAPPEPHNISAESFPRFYGDEDARFEGTIGHLLRLGIHSQVIADALRAPPPDITPAISHC